MGFFNTVLKSVAKKAALAALVVVGKQVLTKAIGSAIDKRKAEDVGIGEEGQAPTQATAPTADETVKAKPVRKSRAKPKPAVVDDQAKTSAKKPAASRSKPKSAGTTTATARKPRTPRKPKVTESKGQEPSPLNVAPEGSAGD
jgi:hypothetical protein